MAGYAKVSHEVSETVDDINRSLFGERAYAEVLIGEFEGRLDDHATDK